MSFSFFDLPRDRKRSLDVNYFGLNTFKNPLSNPALIQFFKEIYDLIKNLKFPEFTNPFQKDFNDN